MAKKTTTIKKIKTKNNKVKNINKIIVNVNSNNKRKTIQGRKDNGPSNKHQMPMSIYFNSQSAPPVQNDIGIGYHKLLDGFSTLIAT